MSAISTTYWEGKKKKLASSWLGNLLRPSLKEKAGLRAYYSWAVELAQHGHRSGSNPQSHKEITFLLVTKRQNPVLSLRGTE